MNSKINILTLSLLALIAPLTAMVSKDSSREYWKFYTSSVPTEYKDVPLVYAAKKNHLKQINALLQYDGSDVNQTDKKGITPLFAATLGGNTEIVKVLLENMADVNKPNIHGSTPLLAAASNGNTQIVKILLKHNADVNKPNKYGDKPLFGALGFNYTEIVRCLLATNKISVEDCKKALKIAKEEDKKAVEKILSNYLLSEDNVEEILSDMMNDMPVDTFNTIYPTEYLTGSLLINKINDMNQLGKKSKSLKVTCDKMIVQMINNKDDFGTTPLIHAVKSKDLNTLKVLLSHPQTLVNARDNTGKSALIYAAENGSIDIIECLLAHKEIDTDIRCNAYNAPALFYALKNINAFKLLCESDKVDVNARNNKDQTILHLTIFFYGKYPNKFEKRLKYIFSRNTVSREAIFKRTMEYGFESAFNYAYRFKSSGLMSEKSMDALRNYAKPSIDELSMLRFER